jgi:nitrogen regulatory protein PII
MGSKKEVRDKYPPRRLLRRLPRTRLVRRCRQAAGHRYTGLTGVGIVAVIPVEKVYCVRTKTEQNGCDR